MATSTLSKGKTEVTSKPEVETKVKANFKINNSARQSLFLASFSTSLASNNQSVMVRQKGNAVALRKIKDLTAENVQLQKKVQDQKVEIANAKRDRRAERREKEVALRSLNEMKKTVESLTEENEALAQNTNNDKIRINQLRRDLDLEKLSNQQKDFELTKLGSEYLALRNQLETVRRNAVDLTISTLEQ